jgi:hypothetical protein
MIDDVVNKLDISDLKQEEPLYIYGGSATDVM